MQLNPPNLFGNCSQFLGVFHEKQFTFTVGNLQSAHLPHFATRKVNNFWIGKPRKCWKVNTFWVTKYSKWLLSKFCNPESKNLFWFRNTESDFSSKNLKFVFINSYWTAVYKHNLQSKFNHYWLVCRYRTCLGLLKFLQRTHDQPGIIASHSGVWNQECEYKFVNISMKSQQKS